MEPLAISKVQFEMTSSDENMKITVHILKVNASARLMHSPELKCETSKLVYYFYYTVIFVWSCQMIEANNIHLFWLLVDIENVRRFH